MSALIEIALIGHLAYKSFVKLNYMGRPLNIENEMPIHKRLDFKFLKGLAKKDHPLCKSV